MLIFGMMWILFTYKATYINCQEVDCASGPCKNDALCEDTEAGFRCFCVDGFAGENCEINFDDCTSSPCRNNATCTDLVAGYTCTCSPGFTGQDCQINIDECISNPCLENGRCIDLVNGFVCECFPPFRGDNCSLLPCDNAPCENEATCRNDVGFNESLSGFVCDCITGFSGPRCEINLEDCDLENFTSCSGNGLCIDGINDYSCLCEPGWVGDYCNFPVDDCIGNSCKNNATCTDLHLGYLCTCKTGYEGSLCERERDECSAWQPCENGAVCVDLFNSYRCECTEGWFGVNCSQEVNECENNDCQNNAQCIDVIGGFRCRCPPFYTGLLCETQFNPCAPEYNPCQNNGNCIVPPDGQYRCYCLQGFSGKHCEVNINECLSIPCENNSTCEDITAGYICHCTPGWQGQNCQNNIDDCVSEPCLNGADCLDLHNGFECNCTQEYQGPTCDDIVDFCLRNPCFHDSTCVSFLGGYRCLCSTPYTGEHCLDLIDTCQSAPCVNNGTCMNTVSGFQCSCPLPFTGITCNDRVDFCESSPCVIGTCVSLVDDFVCICPEYLTGKQCADVVDYCQNSPCENDGNCINAEFDFRCICTYGFTGRTCEQMIDFCFEIPCQNEANCTNIPGGFRCTCPRGLTGDLCQNELPTVISSTILSTTQSLTYSLPLSVSSFSTIPLSTISTDFVTSAFHSLTDTATTITSESVTNSQTSSISPSSVIQHISGTNVATRSVNTKTITFSSLSRSSRDSVSDSEVVLSTSYQPKTTLLTGAIQTSSTEPLISSILTSETSFTVSKDIQMSSMEYSMTSSNTDVISINMHSTSDMSTFTPSILGTSSGISTTSTMSSIEHSLSTSAFDESMSKISSSTSMHIIAPSFTNTTFVKIPISFTPFSASVAITSYSVNDSISKETSKHSVMPATSSKLYPSISNSFLYSVTDSISIETSKHSITPGTSSKLYPSISNSFLSTPRKDTISSSDIIWDFPTSSTYEIFISSPSLADTSSLSIVTSTSDIAASSLATNISPTKSSIFVRSTIYSKSISESSKLYSPKTIVTSTIVSNYDSYTNTEIISLSSVSRSSLSLGASETIDSEIFSMSAELGHSSSLIDQSLSLFTKSPDSSKTSLFSSVSFADLQSSGESTSVFYDQSLTQTQTFDFTSSNIQEYSSMDFSATRHTRNLLDSSFSTETLFPTLGSPSSISTKPQSLEPILSISRISLLTSSSHTQTIYSAAFTGVTSNDFAMSSMTSLVSESLHTSVPSIFSSFLETSIHSDFPKFGSSQSLIASSGGISMISGELFVSSEVFKQLSSKYVALSTSRVETTVASETETPRTRSFSSYSQTSITFGSSSSIFPSLTPISSILSTGVLSTASKLTVNVSRSTFSSAPVSELSSPLTTYLKPSDLPMTKALTSSISTLSTSSDFLIESSWRILPSKSRSSIVNPSLPRSSETTIPSPTISFRSTTDIMAESQSAINSDSVNIIKSVSSISSMSFKVPSSKGVSYKSSYATSSEMILTSTTVKISPSRSLSQTSTSLDTFSSSPSELTSIHKVSTTFKESSKSIYESSTYVSGLSTFLYKSSTSLYGSSTSLYRSPSFTDFPLTSTNTVAIQPSKTTSSVSSSFSTSTPDPSYSCEYFYCYNGGQCREDISGTYCDCGNGYIGSQCQIEATACDGYICENGGSCTITLTIFNVQVPKCSCPLPFYGPRCENEKLIYYPAFVGLSYLEFASRDISSDQSNEIYISIKTNQMDATVLYSASQETDYKQASYIRLYLANGNLRYIFSCDGVVNGMVETDMTVNTGDIYEIIIRQVWSSGPGEWCSAAVIVNSRVFVSRPLLTVTQSKLLGKLYLGGIPRHTYKDDGISDTHIMGGFIGCIHNFQINRKEIDLVTMAITGVNIDNCNVPVCRHNPCKNGATCHSSGEEWYCSCLPGYGGALCERKLCDVNPCQHGGTCIIQEEAQDQLCLCSYGRGGAFCEQVLPVTIPHFIGDQYGYSSYMAYEHPHYVEDDLELEFDIILDNNSSDTSLILFMGNTGSYDGRRDFIVVGLEFGFIVYRFDLGSGYGQIYSARKLDDTLHQHSIKLGRDGNTGWLQVDNQRNVTGRSPGVLTALNTNSKLYFGDIDVPEVGVLPAGAEFEDGFKGCIFNIRIKNHITKFLEPGSPPGHVINGRNLGQCSSMSCEQSPCQNGANCRDIGASIYCVCNEGWKGTFCTDVITVCDLAHACGDGSTCVPDISDGYYCLCPLGKKGAYCEEAVNISDPVFLGEGSFMAFQPVYIKRQINIRLQIKPNTSEGLLFYVAQRLHSHSGDFLALTLTQRRVELRVDVGSGVNTIQNVAEILDSENWYTVEAGRNTTHFYISVDNEIISRRLQGMMTFLDTTTDFFIGGLPNLEDASPDAFENEPVAFHGCIREFVVNDKQYELDQAGAKYGRNIEDCDGTGCGYNVCRNGGSCSTQADDEFICTCKGPFVGIFCDVPIQCSNHSCVNGNCRAGGNDVYVCDCFIGWQGRFCDNVENLETSVEFSAGSYVHFVDDDFRWSNASNTDISFAFKTSLINCLILWNGQTYTEDEDYLGVGIQDGRLKLVWNLGWYSRGEIITPLKYIDERWHNISIERKRQLLVLNVDGQTYESRVSGDFYTLDTFGEFYIGSFKDGDVEQNTLGYFTVPFSGCLRDLQINKKSSVDFSSMQNGVNVSSCDSD